LRTKFGITQAEFAKRLDVSRRTISEIIHERRPITPDIAVRLAHFLDTTPASWHAVDVYGNSLLSHKLCVIRRFIAG
jgi:antitoxin HigA-1